MQRLEEVASQQLQMSTFSKLFAEYESLVSPFEYASSSRANESGISDFLASAASLLYDLSQSSNKNELRQSIQVDVAQFKEENQVLMEMIQERKYHLQF